MKIERIDLYQIALPYVHPFETSFGLEREHHAILVAVRADGLTGWGEAPVSTRPAYSYETTVTAWHVLRDFLAPALLGQPLETVEGLLSFLRPVRGHPMAKAALEAALWDLLARREGLPLARLLGGVRDRVEVGVSIGIQESLPHLLARIEAFREAGYRRIKLKIKPGWDVGVIRAVREQFPDIPLMVDANAAYTLADADRLRALDDFDLLMIEQPLSYDDLVDHARLQARLCTPLCLDESITSPAQARCALELDACRIINIKQARVGGLTAALQIHDLCRSRGVPVWCGGLLETGVGRALNVALATLPGFTLPGDLSATARYVRRDIALPPFELNTEDSTLTVPSGPGLGVEVDEGRLSEVTRRRETLDGTTA